MKLNQVYKVEDKFYAEEMALDEVGLSAKQAKLVYVLEVSVPNEYTDYSDTVYFELNRVNVEF